MQLEGRLEFLIGRVQEVRIIRIIPTMIYSFQLSALSCRNSIYHRSLLLFALSFILAEMVVFSSTIKSESYVETVKFYRSKSFEVGPTMKSRLSEEKERCKFHIQKRECSLLRILVDHEFTAHFRNCFDFDRLWTDIYRFIQITGACIFFSKFVSL